MTFTRQPFTNLNRLVVAALLATAGESAMAQTAPAATTSAPTAARQPDGPAGERMGHRDPAKMQAMVTKRLADIKARLNITAAQEGAWTSFAAAMQPPAHIGGRPTPEQRAEFDKLSAPERIDKMRALRTQRMGDRSSAMDKRGEAAKTLYAALSPEQQKLFDAELKKPGPHGGRGGPGHHGAAGQMKG